MTDNLANPEAIRQRDQRIGRVQRAQQNDLAWVLSDPRGRRFLWRLLKKCGVYESIWDPSGSKMAYNSGRQDLGHFIQAEIVSTREPALLEMSQEAREGEPNV